MPLRSALARAGLQHLAEHQVAVGVGRGSRWPERAQSLLKQQISAAHSKGSRVNSSKMGKLILQKQ